MESSDPATSLPPSAPPPPIWITFAVPAEAKAAHPLRSASVRFIYTGIGSSNARRTFRRTLNEHPPLPAFVISSGFAGGLHPQWRTGDVLFEADPAFPCFERLQHLGAHQARFHTTPHVVVSAEQKAALYRSTGADAVEMESSAIRAECDAQAIPCAIVRVVSDAADQTLPLDFNRFLKPHQRLDYLKLFTFLALRPTTVKQLFQFHRQLIHARNALARILTRTLSD